MTDRRTRPAWLATATTCVAGLVLLAAAAPAPAPQAPRDGIDLNRARRIRDRIQRGEAVSPKDRADLEQARAALRKNHRESPPQRLVPPRGYLRQLPLVDMGNTAYQGQDGGLYGGGRNTPDAALQALADRAAAEVRPLDPQGRPAADGKVVVVSVGMSNTSQEFRRFATLTSRDPEVSPAVVLVDGAHGGMDASGWVDLEASLASNWPDPWLALSERLRRASVTPGQVQVAWVKQARVNPASLGPFPKHAEQLRDDLAATVVKLRQTFPNLRLVFLSSRIYAGFAGTFLNPEPYAFESAFAVRWLIQDQAAGRRGLNADPARGKVTAPVLLWGPYLWADGVRGRATDALVWKREDFDEDGTHPSAGGRQKVAMQLLTFFKTDPTARGWFLKRPDGEK